MSDAVTSRQAALIDFEKVVWSRGVSSEQIVWSRGMQPLTTKYVWGDRRPIVLPAIGTC